jgi:hypothetical protein
MSAVPEFDVLRRHFVAIATAEYDDFRPLPGVRSEVDSLRAWLCSADLGDRAFAISPHLAVGLNPTKSRLREILEDPQPAQIWNHDDAAVVFVTGHGLKADGVHWIILKSTARQALTRTALRTADLVGWLKETQVGHLLLILDMCQAGAVAEDVARFDVDFPRNWLVLAAVTSDQQARSGALTGAVTGFLQELDSAEGRQYGSQPYLQVADFLNAIQDRLPAQRLDLIAKGLPNLTFSPCLPNPHYRADAAALDPRRRDLALRAEDLSSHWGPKSRGVADTSDAGWLFTGRTELMRKLITAATGGPGTVVVTGGAGSGKSTVLARLVTLSDPAFCHQHAERVATIPDDLRPPPRAVDVAVLATGKLPHEVLGQICDALIHPTAIPTPGDSVGTPTLKELLTTWHTWLSDQADPITIVVDALDECPQPATLIRDVLAPLSAPDGAPGPGVRLIVGVRSPGRDASTDSTTEPPTTEPPATALNASRALLADLAVTEMGAERIQVDASPWWRTDDLIEYATEILLTTDPSPYRPTDSGDHDVDDPDHREQARQVAKALAARAATSFLVTGIAATALAGRAGRVDPQDKTWLTAVDEGVLGVFRLDLHGRLRTAEERLRAVHLLRAVAFAYGRGLPWRQIWPLVANAVADDPGCYGNEDISWLLDSPLGAYLVTDTEDDVTVYRIFHDALRETLRQRWQQLLTPPIGETATPRP